LRISLPKTAHKQLFTFSPQHPQLFLEDFFGDDLEDFFEEDFFADDFEGLFFGELFEDFFEEELFLGTLSPSSLASDNPIAIACLGLVTFFPLRPLFNLPSCISCMDFSTFFWEAFEYFAIIKNLMD
jgi:hypothetical protein